MSNFLEQARVSGAEGKLHHMIIDTFVYLLLFCLVDIISYFEGEGIKTTIPFDSDVIPNH